MIATMQGILFLAFLSWISFEDIKTQLISSKALILFVVINMGLELIQDQSISRGIQGAVAGLFLYGAIHVTTKMIYKKEVFGFGDVLLLASIGIVLGAKKTLLAGLLAFYVGLIPILCLAFQKTPLDKKKGLPFAPSIGVASSMVYFFGEEMLSWLESMFF